MYTIKRESFGEYEVKKSKFLSYLVPYKNFAKKLEQLRSEHPKAKHIVWAYRKMFEDGQLDENSTDDGEPKNTSGKPTLNVLYHNNVIDVAIFTVRYFGGVLLGTGGLVKAYTESANRALNNASLIDIATLYQKKIELGYEKINHMEYLSKQYNLKITDREFLGTFVIFTLQGVEKDIESLERELFK